MKELHPHDEYKLSRKRLLLTGAGGFIGAHILEHLLENTEWDIIATDSFRHKGKTDRIVDVLGTNTGHCPSHERKIRTSVVTHDLTAPVSAQMSDRIGPVDYILAVASESHVDRSITDPASFARNNVEVALTTLEFARERMLGTKNRFPGQQLKHIIWVSTDEVYGPIVGDHDHAEWAPIVPSNPYSASKACQEALAISYWRTFSLPLTIVNCMNLIGERQDSEKYLPMLVSKISRGKKVKVHGTPENIGSRHYLHARNLADAMLFLLGREPQLWQHDKTWDEIGVPVPDRYNVVGPDRINNLELAQMVSEIVGEPLHYELQDFHSTRPGHDAHYGLAPEKMNELGWKPPLAFTDSLEKTVKWTLKHPEWLAK